MSVAVAPVAASEAEAQVRPTRMLVGLHEFPAGLEEGDLYDGSPIVRAIPEIGALAVTTYDPVSFAQRQLADPNVRYVENDDPVPLLLEREPVPPLPLATPNDPQYASMYGPQQVRANLAWDTTMGDMDAAVCVIDTGVRTSHEDLGTARYLGGYDFVNNDANPADDQGHGTHVAGTAVGSINNGLGVSGMGNVGYYAVKVLDAGGSGSYSNVAAGITWCANNGIARTVLSMSLGGGGSDQSVIDAIHYAFATKGMLVVAASGNGYCMNCVLFPGRLPEVVGVACTNSAVASCAFTSKGPEVDIAAPGESIVSTCYGADNQYCTKSGTSMSTPHASGILALVWSQETTLTATQLWQRLNETAKDLGDAGKDTTFGWGRIDAQCLITNTLCSLPPPPPPPTNDIFTELFESGTTGWTFTGLWHTSTCRSLSPTTSIAYNNPGSCSTTYDTGAANSGEATSPSVEIPSDATYVRLRLGSWYSTESGGSWDKKTILVSANNGTFTQIYQETGTSATWNALDLDLANFIGSSIRIKFRFDTVDSVANNYEGWYVDSVVVAADVNLGPPTAPGIPVVSVTAGPAPGELNVAWTQPTSGGSPITGYNVFRADSAAGPFDPLASLNATSYIDSGLGNNVTKFYKVSAVNAIGEGTQSLPGSATTFTVPSAPIATVAGGPGVGQLRVTWTPPSNGGTPILSYGVYRSTSVGGPFTPLANTSSTSFTDSGLGNNVTMFYKVEATNAIGVGPLGPAASGTTFAAPGTPVNLAASPGPAMGQISLSWNPGPTGGTPITGYRVYRADNASGPFVLRANVTAPTFTDSGLAEGTRYWYRASAVNIVGEGLQSIDANARTFARPTAPLNLGARPGGQLFSIDLTWQPPGDAGGTPVTSYRVYRDNVYVGSASVVTFRDRNLSPIDHYTYQVAAVNIVGEGPKSNVACARPYPYPSLPGVPSCEILGVIEMPAGGVELTKPDRRTEWE